MENRLPEVIKTSGLEPAESKNILEKFGDFETVAHEWETKAKAIVVTREDQITEMAMAREARKKFSEMRINVEKVRKEMKEQSLRKGQAIDAVARFLTSLIVPIEEHLRKQEDFVKIQEAEKKAEADRIAAEKAEAARLQEEKLKAEEAQRIRLENEKLKAETEKQRKILEEQEKKQEKIVLENKQLKQKVEIAEKIGKSVVCPHCGKSFELEGEMTRGIDRRMGRK